MKKIYEKPVMLAERFVANHYCSACPDPDTYVTYDFVCDAGGGSSYNVFYDTDGDGELSPQEERNEYIGNFHACRDTHSVTVLKGQSIDNIFPLGIIGRTEWVGWERKYVTYPVRIWRGEDGNNIHCTTNLNASEYTPQKNLS